jgi:hypothetical protein
MKRKWVCLLALAIPVIIGAGYLLVPLKEHRISQANCDKIQEGWSEEQVVDLLGLYLVGTGLDNRRYICWSDDDDNWLYVSFKDGCVTEKHFHAGHLSFLDQMKARIQPFLPAWWR